MKHRTDIDGLRAIAILPILLFHAGVTALSGGFLGVDIFFVISGFLITSIITREMDSDNYSIIKFYKRRVVRIFPALFVLLLACFAAGTMLQLPSEFEQLGWSGAAAAGFVSNIYFWKTTDYFGGFAETSALLHTWSLGVEEQFYIFYPIFLILIKKWLPHKLVPVMLALTALSMITSIAMYLIHASAAFYLLPSRVWQLTIGGLIAVGGFPTVARPQRTPLAWLGLSMILFSIIFVREDWMLPFPWGLLPSGGAALVIAYGQETRVHRFLEWSPFRWIGAISYSLYLWHWPLITFYRIQNGLALSILDTIGLIAASILMAAFSYYFIEQPALRHYRQGSSYKVMTVGVASLTGMIAIAIYFAMNPIGWRQLPPEVVRLSKFVDYKKTPDRASQFREGICFSTSDDDRFDFDHCTAVFPEKRNIALIGDSHAAMYWKAMQERFPEENVIQLTSSGCRILPNSKGPKRCQKIIDYAFGTMLEKGDVDTAILAGRWRKEDMSALTRTIDLLQGHGIKVAVIGPVYEFEGDFPLLLARATEMGKVNDMERFRLKSKIILDKTVRETVIKTGAIYYSAQSAECGNEGCVYVGRKGMPLHFDYGHLTEDGAEYVLRNFPAL